jgi:hypothetical protein
LFGLQGVIEKAYVGPERVLCGTRGAAENASARNTENEGAVERDVTIDDGLPPGGVYCRSDFGGSWSHSLHRFFF